MNTFCKWFFILFLGTLISSFSNSLNTSVIIWEQLKIEKFDTIYDSKLKGQYYKPILSLDQKKLNGQKVIISGVIASMSLSHKDYVLFDKNSEPKGMCAPMDFIKIKNLTNPIVLLEPEEVKIIAVLKVDEDAFLPLPYFLEDVEIIKD